MEIINPETPVRLKRSRYEQMIAGVCGGLGKYFEVDPTVVRLVFVLAAFLSVGILAYIVMWIIVPYEEY